MNKENIMNKVTELLQELDEISFQAKQHLKRSQDIADYDKTSMKMAKAISNSISIGFGHPDDVEAAILNISIECIKHLKPELLGR